VTTNPSLIAKEGRPIEEQVPTICDIVDGDISAEVVCDEAPGMIAEGRKAG
jgi:transaldolase